MADITLREFVASLAIEYPEADELVRNARYNISDEAWEGVLWKPLPHVLDRFFEIVLFQAQMDILDMESAPSASDELRAEYEQLRKLQEQGFLEDTKQTFEEFLSSRRSQQDDRERTAKADHKALQQLEVALRKHGIQIALDQPLGLGEWCVDRGIAKKGFGHTLRFPKG